MNFDFTEDQQEIKRTARELLADRSPMAKVREASESETYDDALWSELRELGWPGIAIAEEHGGQGLGTVELAMLLEELGYAVAASPLLSSAMAALAIQEAGSDEQKAQWLPALASGEATGAFGDRRRRHRGDGRRRRRRAGDRARRGRRGDAARARRRRGRALQHGRRRPGASRASARAATPCPGTARPRSTARRWRCPPSSSACASARST